MIEGEAILVLRQGTHCGIEHRRLVSVKYLVIRGQCSFPADPNLINEASVEAVWELHAREGSQTRLSSSFLYA